LKGAVGMLFPAGTRAQSSTFIIGTNGFGARGRIGASYKWEQILHGLEVGPGFGYQYRFNNSNTIPTETTHSCALGGSTTEFQQCHYLGSLSTTRDVLSLSLDGNADLGSNFVAAISLTFYWTRGRDLALVNYMPASGGSYPIPDMSTTHWRNLRWFVF